jgi:hypothetical protein
MPTALRGGASPTVIAARPIRLPLRVALARDPARLLLWLGVRLVIAEIGVVVGLQTPGAIGTTVTVAGLAVLGYVVLLALHVLSLRLEIRPGEARVTSMLVRRRYRLVDGEVTLVRTAPGRASFGTQLGGFGIEIGLGRAASDESVDVVRLAPVATMILIPSSHTRLVIAPSSRRILVRALQAAAAEAGLTISVANGQAPAERASR